MYNPMDICPPDDYFCPFCGYCLTTPMQNSAILRDDDWVKTFACPKCEEVSTIIVHQKVNRISDKLKLPGIIPVLEKAENICQCGSDGEYTQKQWWLLRVDKSVCGSCSNLPKITIRL